MGGSIKRANRKIMKNLIYLAVLVFIVACGKPKDKKAELEKLKKERTSLDGKIADLEKEVGTKPQQQTVDVAVTEVKPVTFNSYVEVQGKVDAQENVQVSAESPGVITAIYVKAGQNVSKGQVLAQLDNKVLLQNVAQVQTQLDLAKNIFQRQKNLWDQKIGTEVQYLNAKAQKDGLEKQMAVLRSQLSTFRLKSPITGTVDRMDLKLGQSVSPGMPGITVVNASNLRVKAELAESYGSMVHSGDDVKVVFPDIPDSLNTQVTFASKVIDPSSRSFMVEVKLPPKRSYRPNMLAILKIVDFESKNTLTVPINSIQRSESGEYVFIAEKGKAKRTTIKSGKISAGQAQVLSGLKAGDKVITAGFQDLNDGDLIKI
ncbi:putative Co/Zn/Cd efflux system membrane fusion protein [Arcticibacter svalbardensis MN12-7]|uniref:Putative Co/Zn/Cd efflux system membrane fusion protein n=2 Tax=Arcticibacter TaxID=1288026 RepID=R9H120_9SPHI|nr:putative Co/Zn/Cd efflux system membrane fusion protein [Arcticibacter svalbardensis MN12-7]